MLEAQVEYLLAGVAHGLDDLRVRHVVHLGRLHAPGPPSSSDTAPSRSTNFVFTGSLWPASRIASRASGSGTPASSNITRPGLTTATQPPGEPLPAPMRGSAGFAGTGLAGQALIHDLPPA